MSNSKEIFIDQLKDVTGGSGSDVPVILDANGRYVVDGFGVFYQCISCRINYYAKVTFREYCQCGMPLIKAELIYCPKCKQLTLFNDGQCHTPDCDAVFTWTVKPSV